jgi:hypothetical protein
VMPPDEVAKVTQIAGKPLWGEWVKRMESKGHPQAGEILNTTLELLKN